MLTIWTWEGNQAALVIAPWCNHEIFVIEEVIRHYFGVEGGGNRVVEASAALR